MKSTKFMTANIPQEIPLEYIEGNIFKYRTELTYNFLESFARSTRNKSN